MHEDKTLNEKIYSLYLSRKEKKRMIEKALRRKKITKFT